MVHILEELCNDIKLIVYKMVHRAVYTDVQSQFYLNYRIYWNDTNQCYFNVNTACPFIASWRKIREERYVGTPIYDMLTKSYMYRISKRGINVDLKPQICSAYAHIKLPTRY